MHQNSAILFRFFQLFRMKKGSIPLPEWGVSYRREYTLFISVKAYGKVRSWVNMLNELLQFRHLFNDFEVWFYEKKCWQRDTKEFTKRMILYTSVLNCRGGHFAFFQPQNHLTPPHFMTFVSKVSKTFIFLGKITKSTSISLYYDPSIL